MGVKICEGNIRLVAKALKEQYFLSNRSRWGTTGSDRRREDQRRTLPEAMRGGGVTGAGHSRRMSRRRPFNRRWRNRLLEAFDMEDRRRRRTMSIGVGRRWDQGVSVQETTNWK
jgi:hypothetical protein